MKDTFQRFSLKQRLEHMSTMAVFTLLCLTGLPQKFYEASWAHAIIGAFGGIDPTRKVHRVAGFLFAFMVAMHLGRLAVSMLRRAIPLSMVPTRKDFRDTVSTLSYYVGLEPHHPPFDRYDYKQKFEYWGMVAGSMIMIASGLLLFFPTFFTRLLPGVLLPAAKLAHSNEGLMAFLVIILWHIFNAHFNPDVFPFDRTIFNGLISRERMEKEHSLELARIEAAESADAIAEGGVEVRGGYYWSVSDWELHRLPGKTGVLPAGQRFVRVPLLGVLILAPLMGAAFAFYLPAAGFFVLAYVMAVKVGLVRRPVPQQAAAPAAQPSAPGTDEEAT